MNHFSNQLIPKYTLNNIQDHIDNCWDQYDLNRLNSIKSALVSAKERSLIKTKKK